MLTSIVEKPYGQKSICGNTFPLMLTIERHDPKARIVQSVCVMTGTIEKHILSGVKWGFFA